MARIWVGWDSRMPEVSDVLVHSLKKRSHEPLEISHLKLSELGLKRSYDPLASTEFTYSRFLVPYLSEYSGIALFMDNDMLCLSDINEALDLDMKDYALRVVKHDYKPTGSVKMDGRIQTSYPRKNWSSFMLMNCAKLRCWTKEAVDSQSGAWLHRFTPIPDELIGDIPPVWNVLDRVNPDTKLVHYTEGGPWFKEKEDHPYGAVWFRERDEMRALSAATSLKLSGAFSKPTRP